jgi:hypothetical protein
MNCRDFRDLLQQHLDGGRIDEAAYDAHRHICPDCAGLHAASVQLLVGLRLIPPPAPPVDLANRITAAVQRSRRQFLGRRRFVVPLAVAAGLLIAIGGRLFLGQWLAGTVPPHSEQTTVQGPAPAVETKGLRDSVAEAGQAVVSLTSRAAGEAVNSARWLVPQVPPAIVPLRQPAPKLPVEALQQAAEGVGKGLAPVADSARRFTDVFLRELPVDFSDNRGL